MDMSLHGVWGSLLVVHAGKQTNIHDLNITCIYTIKILPKLNSIYKGTIYIYISYIHVYIYISVSKSMTQTFGPFAGPSHFPLNFGPKFSEI